MDDEEQIAEAEESAIAEELPDALNIDADEVDSAQKKKDDDAISEDGTVDFDTLTIEEIEEDEEKRKKQQEDPGLRIQVLGKNRAQINLITLIILNPKEKQSSKVAKKEQKAITKIQVTVTHGMSPWHANKIQISNYKFQTNYKNIKKIKL